MLEILGVDTSDEARLRDWYDAWVASQSHRPPEFLESWENARVALPHPHPHFDLRLVVARDGAVTLGAGLLNLPFRANPTVGYAELGTRPEHRRRGVGTALLHEIERLAREAGRDRVLFEICTPPGETTDGVPFAEARGYSLANREETKAVDLDESEPRWAALEGQAEAARGDYRVQVWRDAVPDEYLEPFVGMLGRFMSMVPQGDLDLDDGEWTVDGFLEGERRRAEIGGAIITAVAVAPDGTLAGASDIRLVTHDPRVAHVGITMVLPEHRGHRLGLATKLASHRALRAAFPECRLVDTSNANVNAPMNAINEALGYRVLEDLLEYHRRI